MAKWWPFGRKRREEPAPERREPPKRPTPPEREAPKGPGRLGRLFGRKRREEPAPERREPKPKAPAGEAGGEGAPPERQFPGSAYVSASGGWRVSNTWWEGTMHGELSGSAVEQFMLAMERDDRETAIGLIAGAYGLDDLVDVGGSRIDHIGY